MSSQDEITNDYRSLYEKLLEELAANGQIIVFTSEENLAILTEMNECMEEFCEAERTRSAETLLEARHIRIW